jgi:hypothetical protein
MIIFIMPTAHITESKEGRFKGHMVVGIELLQKIASYWAFSLPVRPAPPASAEKISGKIRLSLSFFQCCKEA